MNSALSLLTAVNWKSEILNLIVEIRQSFLKNVVKVLQPKTLKNSVSNLNDLRRLSPTFD